MTPTPGGMPKPQSSQQPGNEPGGANGMYGRFGQTPGQQPSQGFRQKVDGMRRGFGGQRQQRGGMRQASGMGQMQNNNVRGMTGGSGQSNARQADRSQDQGREAYSQQLRSIEQSQGQPASSSYRSSGQYDRDRAGGMQDDAVAGRETLFNATQQPMQQADYGRFAPGPAAGAMESRASANPFGGDDDIAFDVGGTGSMVVSGGQYDRDQQPVSDAASTDPTIVANREAKRRAQGAPVGAVQNTQYMGSDQPMPTATTTQAQPSVAPVQNTQNMGGQQSPPVATTTQAQPAPSGFASPFGMMRFGAPPAAPEQLKADDMQPRDTFQTGQSSLRQPMSSLEGQSRRRRERFGYGA